MKKIKKMIKIILGEVVWFLVIKPLAPKIFDAIMERYNIDN